MRVSESLHFIFTLEILLGDANLSHVAETRMESRHLHFSDEKGKSYQRLSPMWS